MTTQDLDLGGGQARLQRLLRPLDFTLQMERYIASFTGRLWLLADIDAWLASPTGSRVLWLTGGPGMGKSAIAAHLCQRPEAIAHHFCVHGDDDKSSPTCAILSIAFQMAAHLPEYNRRLQALDLEEEVANSPATLFDHLVVQPLATDFPAPDGPRLIIIDALDEATVLDSGGRMPNAIAQIVHEQGQHVPAWLRLFITSRPEVELLTTFQQLAPLVLNAQRPENLADIREFFQRELSARARPHDESALSALVARSEGMFLYATELLHEIDAGREIIDGLPQGMKGHYHRFFARQMPDMAAYHREIQPILECICAAAGPLPLGLLARAVELAPTDLHAQLALVGSWFPIQVSGDADEEHATVAPFHKSLAQWLSGMDGPAQDYALQVAQGVKRLAEACMRATWRGSEGMSAYELRFAPGHLLAAGRAGDAAQVMTDFGYHYARIQRLGGNDVVAVMQDFAALAQAPLPAAQRALVQIWRRFHDETARFLWRPDVIPEIELLQKAYAHADTSPVTRSAETWLAQHDPKTSWLRSLCRPKKIVRTEELRVLEGHIGPVVSVALHADGRRAVSGARDDFYGEADTTVRVWDLDTGACLAKLEGHTNAVMAVALHGDGRRAVTGSWDHTWRVWDLDTGTCLRVVDGQPNGVFPIALCPDGCRAVLEGGANTLRVLDLDSGACLHMLEGHTNNVRTLAVCADGRRVVSGSNDKTLRVWDLDTGTCLRVLEGHTAPVNSVAVCTDSRSAISGSDDKTVRVWDLDTGTCLRVLEGHNAQVNSVGVWADGRRVVSGSDDKTVRVWDLHTGTCLRVLEGHTSGIRSVAVHADGRRVVSGGDDWTVRVWDLDSGEVVRPRQGHSARVRVAMCADGRRAVSASEDKTLRVWDLQTGACLRVLEGHTGGVFSVAVLADDRRIVSWSNDDGELRVWDLDTGACLHVLEGHSKRVWSVAIVRGDRRAISGSWDGTVRVWNLDTGACLRVLRGHTDWVLSVAAHADGRRAVSGGGDRTLRIWDLDTGVCLRALQGHSERVWVVACADDHRAVSGSWDKTLRVWNLDTGACLRVLEGHTDRILSVEVFANGRRAVTGSGDHTLRVWDLDTGKCLRVLEGHTDWVILVALCADGRRAISESRDRNLRVWDLDTGVCLGTYGGASIFRSVSFWRRPLASGRIRVGTGSDDGTLHFLELTPPGPLVRTTQVAWSPTHPLVAVAFDSGAVILHQWHAASAHLEEIACLAPTSAPISSLRFSIDGTLLQVVSPDGAERILDATALQPAAPPTYAWSPSGTTSPDNAWRADIENGRLRIVPAGSCPLEKRGA